MSAAASQSARRTEIVWANGLLRASVANQGRRHRPAPRPFYLHPSCRSEGRANRLARAGNSGVSPNGEIGELTSATSSKSADA